MISVVRVFLKCLLEQAWRPVICYESQLLQPEAPSGKFYKLYAWNTLLWHAAHLFDQSPLHSSGHDVCESDRWGVIKTLFSLSPLSFINRYNLIPLGGQLHTDVWFRWLFCATTHTLHVNEHNVTSEKNQYLSWVTTWHMFRAISCKWA